MPDVTVAIPVRDGGETFARVLAALRTQTVEHDLLICDSGSRDASMELARSQGARVLEIPAERFSHGGTRNLLVREAATPHVAFLTQDAQPVDAHWLEHLLAGFDICPEVALVYGPYRPRPYASAAVRIEIEQWFGSLSPDGNAQVERLGEQETLLPAVALMGRRGFFTDANACLSRAAWEHVPFREVPYAEDRVLAVDMLRAGYVKVFMPQAAVWHSHDYTALQYLRRCFDEWRGLGEVYDWREPASPKRLAKLLRGELRNARGQLAATGMSPAHLALAMATVSRHHIVRLAGAILGSRAQSLPAWAQRWLSLERRAGFAPLKLDG